MKDVEKLDTKEELWLTLYSSAKNEISNAMSENGREIIILLEDKAAAKVWVEEIKKPKVWEKTQNDYVKKHEFWPESAEIACAPITPLTLRNVEDLYAYIEDVLECNYENFDKTRTLEFDGKYYGVFVQVVEY